MHAPLPSLQKLIKQLQKVPYLASKNIYKVVSYFLECDDSTVEQLCQALKEVKSNIVPCQRCFNWTEQERLCAICRAPGRVPTLICVVETWHDLIAIERAGGFSGVYHVLGGVLSPLEGVGPERLRIKELLTRLEDGVQEIILGMNPTPEGDATASYLASKLNAAHVKVSRFASGIPSGASLEFMDKITIAKALSGRVPF